MQQEHLEEWMHLQDAAVARLCEPARRNGYVLQAHAAVLPSFHDGRACTLLKPDSDRPNSLAMRTVWRMQIDNPKFSSPIERLRHPRALQPTITESEVFVPNKLVDALLAGIHLPPGAMEDPGTTLDGTIYRLFVLGRKFEWNYSPPTGWENLNAVVGEIEKLVYTPV